MKKEDCIAAVQTEFPAFSGRLYTACRRTPETGVTLCSRARELAGMKKPENRVKGIHWSIRVNAEQDALLKRRMDKLHYGTLSDPQSVDKTAEEIRTSKQRSYAAVCDVQQGLQTALEHLVWVMDFYASLYKLAPRGEYDVNFTWGDGILQDTDKEFVRRLQLVSEGHLRAEKLISWYFGISEEQALTEYMPESSPPMFEE